jgi:hypothetical protein
LLPTYVPKALVEFDGQLNDAAVKHIELSNPSAKPLVYSVRVDGGPEFRAESSLKLGPKERVLFPVTSFHTFRRDAEAQASAPTPERLAAHGRERPSVLRATPLSQSSLIGDGAGRGSSSSASAPARSSTPTQTSRTG